MSKNTAEVQTIGEEIRALAQLSAEISDANWGATERMDANDLLIPKIYHQQGLSKFVADGKARSGDFCDSLTGDILAKKDEKLEVIIFDLVKTMIISKQIPGTDKYKLEEIITITPENAVQWADHEFYEETPQGKMKYVLTYNYYCLLPSKINELPFVLSLSVTKVKIAKTIGTMMNKRKALGKPGASIVFELKSVQESNDSGTWFGLSVDQGRDSTAAELTAAYKWYTRSQKQKLVVEEEDSEHVTGTPNY